MANDPGRAAPIVSVIIATRNRQDLLARTLDSLAAQTWPHDRLEIVVADNGSTDATRAVAAAGAVRPGAPAVKYLYVDTPGKSYAVNAAIELARGDVLAFTDDDVRAEPMWIERLVAALDETNADFVAGRMRPMWEVPPPRWMSPALYGVLAIPDNGDRRLPIGPGINDHIVPVGANMAVRAAVVRRVGGLRVDLGKIEGSLRTGEDHEFFLRMLHGGCRGGLYEPTAVADHWVPRDRLVHRYFRRWLYDNGRIVARLEREYPPAVRRLLGIPRYLWRQAAADAWQTARSAATGNAPRRFAAAVRLLWFAGYAREAWFGGTQPRSADMRLVEQR